MRRTHIPNCNPIGRWKRGKKSGKPKTGENKILVIDANFKQSTNVLLAKFWHAVFGLANDGNSVTYV